MKNVNNDPFFDKTLPFTPDPNYAPYSIKPGVSQFNAEKYEKQAFTLWDQFYKRNTTKAYKDRHWLRREFSELTQGNDKKVLLEVGCGVGNTDVNPNLFIYCFDFAASAINLLKQNPKFSSKRIHAFVCDITRDELQEIPDQSVDFITLIFVLGAMSPEKMQIAVRKLSKKLKVGGYCFIRDHGRNDLSQKRFSQYNKIDDNFFARQDGTRVFYFTPEFVKELFLNCGFEELENKFVIKDVENVKEKKVMRRVFVQSKFRKL